MIVSAILASRKIFGNNVPAAFTLPSAGNTIQQKFINM